MFTSNPITALTALAGGILFSLLIDSKKAVIKNIKYYIIFFILITAANPLFSSSGNTILFSAGIFKITLESLLYGAGLGVMIITVMIWCQSYSLIMTSDKYAALFKGRMPKLSLVISMTLRYIPMLKRQWNKIYSSQRTLGMCLAKKRFDKIRFFLNCFLILISWSLENAVQTVKSMEARGWGSKSRTSYSHYRCRQYDIILTSVCLMLFFSVIILKFLGYTDFSYYPEISGTDLTPGSVLSHTLFGLLVFLPSLTELEETVRWNCCKSKI